MIRPFVIAILFLTFTIKISAQIFYTSPVNESKFHPVQTSIFFKGTNDAITKLWESTIVITGSKSGEHSYKTRLINENTLILIPCIIFSTDETILVQSDNQDILKFFTTKKEGNDSTADFQEPESHILNQKNVPDGFPPMKIDSSGVHGDGRIFFYNISAMASYHDRYLAIMNSDGYPVFNRQLDNNGLGFTLQKNGYLTYWSSNGNFKMLDSTYAIIDSFACGNGYSTDWHELQILENNHAFLLSYDKQPVDMSQVVENGDPNANVEGVVLQELDENKNVIFQWRSWDHYQITDATNLDLTNDLISFVHGNAIDIDSDGNILLSARRLDEITKIDRNTGNIIWRLGGKNNQFTFLNDTSKFSRQHDIRRIENGNITLFDNGNFHDTAVSVAKEYQLDEVNMTAELVWSFKHPMNIFSETMGNVQRLSNGNTFINWGTVYDVNMPAFTEVDPDGNIVYEVTFTTPFHLVYRAFRYDWTNPYDTTMSYSSVLQENSLSVFPNPAIDFLYVQLSNPHNLPTEIRILGLNSKAIRETRTNNETERISLNGISSGVYLVEVKTENRITYKKLIITR